MAKETINEDEVIDFLHSWKDGIISIGQEFLDHKDYKAPAQHFIAAPRCVFIFMIFPISFF